MRVLISCTSPDVVVRTSRVPICDHSRHVIRYVILSTVSRVLSATHLSVGRERTVSNPLLFANFAPH